MDSEHSEYSECSESSESLLLPMPYCANCFRDCKWAMAWVRPR